MISVFAAGVAANGNDTKQPQHRTTSLNKSTADDRLSPTQPRIGRYNAGKSEQGSKTRHCSGHRNKSAVRLESVADQADERGRSMFKGEKQVEKDEEQQWKEEQLGKGGKQLGNGEKQIGNGEKQVGKWEKQIGKLGKRERQLGTKRESRFSHVVDKRDSPSQQKGHGAVSASVSRRNREISRVKTKSMEIEQVESVQNGREDMVEAGKVSITSKDSTSSARRATRNRTHRTHANACNTAVLTPPVVWLTSLKCHLRIVLSHFITFISSMIFLLEYVLT